MTPVPHRTLTTVLTAVVPAALVAGTFVVAGAWRDELPDPVAVHFGNDGPDGFGSVAGLLWPPAIIALVVAAACWARRVLLGSYRATSAGSAPGWPSGSPRSSAP